MMLDEMKNNERPTITNNMDDSIEFNGGEVTLKTGGAKGDKNRNLTLKNELNTTFMAFEERLEKMMQ